MARATNGKTSLHTSRAMVNQAEKKSQWKVNKKPSFDCERSVLNDGRSAFCLSAQREEEVKTYQTKGSKKQRGG